MKLHIGCMGEAIEGFKRLDAQQYGNVDFVQDAKDLSNFETESVEEIYASHIFEHFTKPEAMPVLMEWHRVLVKGGTLYISVPDFDRIIEIYLRMGRVLVTWINNLIHGDQEGQYSFHYACYTYSVLSGMLSQAGFQRVEYVEILPYGLMDASQIRDTHFGIYISLNVRAVK